MTTKKQRIPLPVVMTAAAIVQTSRAGLELYRPAEVVSRLVKSVGGKVVWGTCLHAVGGKVAAPA